MRNKRDVWHINTVPSKGRAFRRLSPEVSRNVHTGGLSERRRCHRPVSWQRVPQRRLQNPLTAIISALRLTASIAPLRGADWRCRTIRQYKPRDKITQKMTRDGLIEVNETKETAERVSNRKKDADFSRPQEQPWDGKSSA